MIEIFIKLDKFFFILAFIFATTVLINVVVIFVSVLQSLYIKFVLKSKISS
jgi:hypothetical protein